VSSFGRNDGFLSGRERATVRTTAKANATAKQQQKQMRGFFASLRWDERGRTFLVRALGTDIP
jgi:hypothetical protein